MNYSDLLKSDEWKKKRKKILERDNYECQRCGVAKNKDLRTQALTVSSKDFGLFKKIEFVSDHGLNSNVISLILPNDKKILAKTNFPNGDLDKGLDYAFVINLAFKNSIIYPYNGSTLFDSKNNIFHGQSNTFFHNTISKKLKDSNTEIDKEGIWFVPKDKINEFAKDNVLLHVHHKCYRQNIEIWNQKDEEYVTLCNVCHSIVHHNQLIPYYDGNGNIFQYMTPCPKCDGRRRLECYKHVDNGICYRCMGTGKINTLTNIGHNF